MIQDQDLVWCEWFRKYDQLVMLQDEMLKISNINSLGDLIVTMKKLLSSNNTILPYHLTKELIEQTQNETTQILNIILQNIVNNSEISWALDDAIEIYLTTGSAVISGL